MEKQNYTGSRNEVLYQELGDLDRSFLEEVTREGQSMRVDKRYSSASDHLDYCCK